MKHTPGPWKTWPSIHKGRAYVVENNYKATDYGHVAAAVTEADAQLIAAAPELLEALQTSKLFFEAMIEDQRCGDMFTAAALTLDKINHVIKKAEGAS